MVKLGQSIQGDGEHGLQNVTENCKEHLLERKRDQTKQYIERSILNELSSVGNKVKFVKMARRLGISEARVGSKKDSYKKGVEHAI